MAVRTCLLLFFICCLSCTRPSEEKALLDNDATEMTFDKRMWKRKEDEVYPYRDKMLRDLIDHVKLKGLKRDEVLELLGKPDRIDSNYLFYRVSQKRVYFISFRTETLVVKFAHDTVEWRKIHQ